MTESLTIIGNSCKLYFPDVTARKNQYPASSLLGHPVQRSIGCHSGFGWPSLRFLTLLVFRWFTKRGAWPVIGVQTMAIHSLKIKYFNYCLSLCLLYCSVIKFSASASDRKLYFPFFFSSLREDVLCFLPNPHPVIRSVKIFKPLMPNPNF